LNGNAKSGRRKRKPEILAAASGEVMKGLTAQMTQPEDTDI
jgi:hypothetical protein